MREFTIVVNECETPGLPNVQHVRTRDTPNGVKNFSVRFDKLAAGLPRTLGAHELDWLDILAALYAADLACDRGDGDTDWARDITAFATVRDPAAWDPLRVDFQELFMDLTLDRLRLELRAETEPSESPRTADELSASDSVALISGGVDSYAGALELLDAGRAPLFLSHASGGIARYQRHVEKALKSIRPEAQFAAFGAEAVRTGGVFPGSEGSQRSRTLLFMGVASLVAATFEAEEVFLNENGVMAVHVPLSPARIGSLSTRTATPSVLQRMGRLASSALDAQISVENLLLEKTKPDVVELAAILGDPENLAGTASCWSIGRTSTHCGHCAPCMMRRISFLLHGVSDVAYGTDVLNDREALDNPTVKDNVSQLCQFINDLCTLSDAEIFLEYPELTDGAPALSAAESIALYRRWGDQAMSVLRQYPVPTSLLP